MGRASGPCVVRPRKVSFGRCFDSVINISHSGTPMRRIVLGIDSGTVKCVIAGPLRRSRSTIAAPLRSKC